MEHKRIFENIKEPKQLKEIFGDKEPTTGRQIQFALWFEPAGTFGAINDARQWLKNEGYEIGSMQGDAPIGFAKGVSYIAKWRNISPNEWKYLDGVLISEDFREGGVKILFFVFPD